jgi:hypothetical protein
VSEPAFERAGLMPFRLLLDEAVRWARRYVRPLFSPVAVPVALSAAVISAIQALWLGDEPLPIGSFGSPFASTGVMLLTLLNIVLLLIAYTALQAAAVDAAAGRPVDMKRAWRFAIRPRVLGTSFLTVAAIVLSFLCCGFPALYVAPLLFFVTPAMAEEGVFGFRAMTRSAELTRFNPKRSFLDNPLVKAFACLLVIFLLSYYVSAVVSLPFLIPMYVDMIRKLAEGGDTLDSMGLWLWLQVPAQFLAGLATTAVYLYGSFAAALLFFDTRARREGSDLQAEIEAVFPRTGPPASLPGEPPL